MNLTNYLRLMIKRGEHHTVESIIPPFGRDLILVTFGYDEGFSSCGQIESLDGIDSNANDQHWLTQWGLLLKHRYFVVHGSLNM